VKVLGEEHQRRLSAPAYLYARDIEPAGNRERFSTADCY
jgi:hypothetical protein